MIISSRDLTQIHRFFIPLCCHHIHHPYNGWRSLHMKRFWDLLLVHRDTLETTDLHGRTILCWAAECRFEAGVELLLKKGVVLRPPRRSPLLCALANDHASIVRMLLERDIDHSFHTISDGGAKLSGVQRK